VHQDEAVTATAGAAAAGGALAAAVRLEQGTYSDAYPERTPTLTLQGYRGYRANLINYGEGLAECAFAFISGSPRRRGIRGQSEAREENEKRASRRAASKVRRLVLTGKLDTLLTLTYRDNVTGFEVTAAHIARFERTVRAKYPLWKCVAVPERQKRGAWHWHLAVPGWQDVAFLRATWRTIAGEGNIDLAPPRRPRGHRLVALARYLAKYLTKGFAEGRVLNRHRYRASRGIEIPLQVIPLRVRTLDAALEAVRALVAGVAGTAGYEFVDDEHASGIVFSWG